MKHKKLTMFAAAACVVIAGLAIGLTACGTPEPEPEAEEPPKPVINPLTGITVDQGFDENALTRRPVAIVVENSPSARPQWGMDDENYSPDIILEGEVEGGITRTLWFYADQKKLPEQIGPMRSARPPYIRFSELFDAIFIHWGQSHSKGDYIGAKEVFKTDVVDHINQMSFENKCGLYDRDFSRPVSSEHTGIIYGDKVDDAIEEYGCRKKPRKDGYTELKFNETAQPMGDTPANEIRVDYSTRSDWETTVWSYDPEDKLYHTDNFQNDLVRDNLLILWDETEYITKSDYQGAGGSVTYCDYKLGGGKGTLISQGTAKEIEWQIKDRKLYLIDVAATKAAQEQAEAEAAEEPEKKADDEEAAEPAAPIVVEACLNPGKTWIGWVSSNNGGKVEVLGSADEASDEDTDDSGEEPSAPEEIPEADEE